MPLSESAADTIYSLARIFLVLASIFGVTGTIGLFWAGATRDQNISAPLEEQIEAAQKISLKWEGEATLAQKELARLKSGNATGVSTPAFDYKLSDEQKSTIVTRLKFLSKAPIRMACYQYDDGTKTFGENLLKVLMEAGYTVAQIPFSTTNNGPGIHMVVGQADTPPDGAMELLGILTGLGIPCVGIAANTTEMTDIYIEIGPPVPAR